MAINPQRKLELSPEARAKLALPVAAHGYELMDAFGCLIGTIDHFGDNALDASFADFIAALVNEALTPAAPAALCEYDDCDQAALPGGDFCSIHQAEHDELLASEELETTTELRQLVTTELEAEQHWTAEEIMRREG